MMNLLFLSITSTILCTLIALAFKYLSILRWISGHAYVLSKRKEPFSILEVLDLFKNVRPFPISGQKGWKIDSYANGHRIWFNFLTFPHNTNAPSIKVFAVFGRIQSSCQALLHVLKDTSQACEWKPGIISSSHTHVRTSYESSITSRGLPSMPVQVDCVKEEKLELERRQSTVALLLGDSWHDENVIRTKSVEYKRFWHREDNGVCWLLQMSEELQMCEFFLIQPVEELDQCLVSVLTWSRSHTVRSFQWGSILLSALEDYICLRRLQKTPLTTITLPQDFSESQGDSSDDNQRHESFSQDRFYLGKSKHNSLDRSKQNSLDRSKHNSLDRKSNHSSETISNNHSHQTDIKKKYTSILRYNSNISSSGDSKLESDSNANTTKPTRATLVRSVSDGAALKQSRQMNKEMESFDLSDEEDTDGMEDHKEEGGDEFVNPLPVSQSISDEDIELARYKMMSNQCAADLMAEALRASNINLDFTPERQAETSGGWVFSSFEKNIVILKKVQKEQSTVQSFIGKGFVLAPPKTVWDAVRNPRTRFTYDDTLKKVDIIDKIDSELKIVYFYHESMQFLAKESYDLSVLQGERQEGDKYILTYSSVESPKCPVNPNCTRATFLPSGWIIEPARQDNKVYSIITYLMQLDCGPPRENSDKLPFQDMICRHPLSIDELQKYLRPAVQLLRRKSTSNAQV